MTSLLVICITRNMCELISHTYMLHLFFQSCDHQITIQFFLYKDAVRKNNPKKTKTGISSDFSLARASTSCCYTIASNAQRGLHLAYRGDGLLPSVKAKSAKVLGSTPAVLPLTSLPSCVLPGFHY